MLKNLKCMKAYDKSGSDILASLYDVQKFDVVSFETADMPIETNRWRKIYKEGETNKDNFFYAYTSEENGKTIYNVSGKDFNYIFEEV